ncbi:hypothetical protein GCM10025865_24170 [Paraoerskovia sediminicola]|uniref:Uncharacterized protein n=1 Tax=Paraoerskovia sediminicola TaxID=1138587 RepID=A0ABN6XIK9_9CELL|nr:hypothetical protein [Paraoerskovia sediminicola]BDZ43118.1 hypothetical protein GCM10025865_24170 [Paraoerskovia sediminicola]
MDRTTRRERFAGAAVLEPPAEDADRAPAAGEPSVEAAVEADPDVVVGAGSAGALGTEVAEAGEDAVGSTADEG